MKEVLLLGGMGGAAVLPERGGGGTAEVDQVLPSEVDKVGLPGEGRATVVLPGRGGAAPEVRNEVLLGVARARKRDVHGHVIGLLPIEVMGHIFTLCEYPGPLWEATRALFTPSGADPARQPHPLDEALAASRDVVLARRRNVLLPPIKAKLRFVNLVTQVAALRVRRNGEVFDMHDFIVNGALGSVGEDHMWISSQFFHNCGLEEVGSSGFEVQWRALYKWARTTFPEFNFSRFVNPNPESGVRSAHFTMSPVDWLAGTVDRQDRREWYHGAYEDWELSDEEELASEEEDLSEEEELEEEAEVGEAAA